MPLPVLDRQLLPAAGLVPIGHPPEFQARCLGCAQSLDQQRLTGNGRQITSARALLPVHAGNHDLPHNRSGRRHLWRDAIRQAVGDRRQPLLHRLPGGANIHVPAELDIDHRQAGGRLAADCLDTTGPQQGNFDRLSDQRFDLLGGQPGALGDDHHPGPVEIGKDVDRQQRRQIAAVPEQRKTAKQHQQPGAKREADDGVEHEQNVSSEGKSGRRAERVHPSSASAGSVR